ncbi:MAG: hypothetical protein WCJ69_17680 [Betaproteobacteria bacterium]|jgi:uncharacterized lipoprotein
MRIAPFALLVALAGCATPWRAERPGKIGFDLSAIDADGLEGPPDGKRAVDYEFCVPAGDGYVAEVRVIDPSAQALPGSRGRIGCRPGQVLVMGHTHRPGWRQSLERLTVLRYVRKIEKAVYE